MARASLRASCASLGGDARRSQIDSRRWSSASGSSTRKASSVQAIPAGSYSTPARASSLRSIARSKAASCATNTAPSSSWSTSSTISEIRGAPATSLRRSCAPRSPREESHARVGRAAVSCGFGTAATEAYDGKRDDFVRLEVRSRRLEVEHCVRRRRGHFRPATKRPCTLPKSACTEHVRWFGRRSYCPC